MEIDHQGTDFLDPPPPGRQIYCNRTLNLRSLKAIGYDMDYTLLHYHVDRWEARAFHHLRRKLVEAGWPVEGVEFDPQAVCRGLIIDLELGNIVKANRFGYIKAACHGTEMLDFDQQRRMYARTVIDLGEPRWVFLNTLFSLSAGSMYRALVTMLDNGELPGERMNYTDLYRTMQRSLDAAHMEGQLKAEIMADPDRFVALDPDTPITLLDQKRAGKKLLLITNSGWVYTLAMMRYAFDPFLPEGMSWRDLFDIIIVSARKPAFFSENLPAFEVVDDSGLLRPSNGRLEPDKAYFGGHAGMVEETLGLKSAQILYIGDHVYGDVHVSKSIRRWRTALIAREMEAEVEALTHFQPIQQQLSQLMRDKVALEQRASRVRLQLQRLAHHPDGASPILKANLKATFDQIIADIVAGDDQIRPLAVAASKLGNPEWGLIMRTGNDKSLMARQVERHADVYTSRVSNFLYETPFSYIRSSRGSLPHDPEGAINPFQSDG